MNKLSLELVSDILAHLKPSSDTSPTPIERATLIACCLVHPTWRAEVQPWLFHHVGPDLSMRQLGGLCDTLTTRPLYRRWVAELELPEPLTVNTFARPGAKRELEDLFEALLSLCDTVTLLSIRNPSGRHRFGDLHVNPALIFASSRLEQLSLVGNITLDPEMLSPNPPGYRSMTSLAIVLYASADPEFEIHASLLSAPNLRTITIGASVCRNRLNFENRVIGPLHALSFLRALDISPPSVEAAQFRAYLPDLAIEKLTIHWAGLHVLGTLAFLPPSLRSLAVNLRGLRQNGVLPRRHQLEELAKELVKGLEGAHFPELETLLFLFPTGETVDVRECGLVTPELKSACAARGTVIEMSRDGVHFEFGERGLVG